MLEVTDFENIVNKFTKIYHQDPNSRYRSFDHMRTAFLENRNDEEKRKFIALHLYAYLASWGMLRNSFLMQKDYLFLLPVVDILRESSYDCLLDFDPFDNKKIYSETILCLAESIKKYFLDKTYYSEGNEVEKEVKNVTQTLISKIILGTFGCTVAYDRYVRVGLKDTRISQSINEKSIMHICTFAQDHEDEIKKMLNKLNKSNSNKLYTPMKIIDMYFFEKGFELENENNAGK